MNVPKTEKKFVLIKNGKKMIENTLNEFRQEQKSYRESIKFLGKGLMYRATHVERGKRVYHYWYKYEWDPVKKRTVHKYIGKQKPQYNIPNPPENPLATLNNKEIIEIGNDLVISEGEFKKNSKLFGRFKTKKLTTFKSFIEEYKK